jgi:hypothetical protein
MSKTYELLEQFVAKVKQHALKIRATVERHGPFDDIDYHAELKKYADFLKAEFGSAPWRHLVEANIELDEAQAHLDELRRQLFMEVTVLEFGKPDNTQEQLKDRKHLRQKFIRLEEAQEQLNRDRKKVAGWVMEPPCCLCCGEDMDDTHRN